ASAVSGRGTDATFKALLEAAATARLPSQAGNCSHNFVAYLGQEDDYNLVAFLNHDYDLVWFADPPDKVAYVHLANQELDCPNALNRVIADILQYEQEVLALNPHGAGRAI